MEVGLSAYLWCDYHWMNRKNWLTDLLLLPGRYNIKSTNLCTLANDHLPNWILLSWTQFSQWGQISSLEGNECVHSLQANVGRIDTSHSKIKDDPNSTEEIRILLKSVDAFYACALFCTTVQCFNNVHRLLYLSLLTLYLILLFACIIYLFPLILFYSVLGWHCNICPWTKHGTFTAMFIDVYCSSYIN